MNQNQRLKTQLERQAKRMQKAERERPTLLAETVYLGTLGLLFVLPVVGGAYLGRWLDTQAAGYSLHWTLNLILLGVMLGALNVYLFIRK
ncbi:MAG: AtpZ/AtpI family protein [Candidatus Competibacteraceae bacterium]|nr:AtpZ/AtpI family protein [Candidatus Competibacteraceae bacterium]MCB1804024.1 AtpZ/AtpI family protein [Candidatus Competibacteraceae bacterium]MCB1812950.1 AtpZ/AtpI family protein [Candidatus Competibacteraceae bacterium]